MKAKNHIKPIKIILPIFGLVLLLLLSPCKVRNFAQAKLDIPQTEVSNKSKTITHNSPCSDLEIAIPSFTEKKSYSQQLAVITKNADTAFSAEILHTFSQPNKASNTLTAAVPLYILYQNFKDYL